MYKRQDDNQSTRWGSATPAHGTIRIARQVAGMPDYVRDYVLLHELAHLIEPGHGPRFWALLAGYDRLERARGYLDGYAAARVLTAPQEGPDANAESAGTIDCAVTSGTTPSPPLTRWRR